MFNQLSRLLWKDLEFDSSTSQVNVAAEVFAPATGEVGQRQFTEFKKQVAASLTQSLKNQYLGVLQRLVHWPVPQGIHGSGT